MSLATLLVLADGRLPAGGHAHSGGLEAAVSAGRLAAPSAPGASGRIDAPSAAGSSRRIDLPSTAGTSGAISLPSTAGTSGAIGLPSAHGSSGRIGAPSAARTAGGTDTSSAAGTSGGIDAPSAAGTSGGIDAPSAAGTAGRIAAFSGAGASRGVRDLAGLEGFLRGRLTTAGRVAAAFAAVACARPDEWRTWDAGLDARTPSPALRRASRAQGRALLRAGRAMWPVPDAGRDPHHPVALGVVARAAGLGPAEAAIAAAHGTVTGPASAAVRLLGLDPYAVHAQLAALAPECDRIAAEAAAHVGADVDDLPAAGAPLLDIGAEHHAGWEVRLFAS